MYYNLYHASNLREIVRFLREIGCIEFEWNAFVLVSVQIDLIHFEHKNLLVQLQSKLIQIRYIKGQYIQFRVKSDTWYKPYHINLYVKPFQYSICIRSILTKTNTEISFSFWLTFFYSIFRNWFHIIFRRIVLEVAQNWRELVSHYFPADCFQGNSDTDCFGINFF